MYSFLSFALLALGLILLFSPDTILSKDSSYYKTINENSKMLAAACLAGAYYTYTLSTAQGESESASPLLPSYDEATTTSE